MIVSRYQLDKTGINPDNYVSGEVHVLNGGLDYSAVVPKYGAFYTDSLVVYDDSTNKVLVKGTDYITVELVKEASLSYGKEINLVILIDKKSNANVVRINYQVLGGPYENQTTSIDKVYDAIVNDTRGVDWVTGVFGKPYQYNPSLHTHYLRDVRGFEPVVDVLERINRSLEIRTTRSYELLVQWVISQVDSIKKDLDTTSKLKLIDDSVSTNALIIENSRLNYFNKINSKLKDLTDMIDAFKLELNSRRASEATYREDFIRNAEAIMTEMLGIKNSFNDWLNIKLKGSLPYLAEHDLVNELPSSGVVSYDQLMRILDARLQVTSTVAMVNVLRRVLGGIRIDTRVNTTKVEDGYVYHWCISKDNTSSYANDYTNKRVVINNNTGEVTLDISDADLAHYDDTLYIKLRKYTEEGMVVSTSMAYSLANILANNIQLANVPTNITNIGDRTINITSDNLDNNTELTWNIRTTNLSTNGFATTSGKVNMVNNAGKFNLDVIKNSESTRDGNFYIEIIDGLGNVLFNSSNVTVHITSNATISGFSYDVTTDTEVNGTLAVENVADNTVYTWEVVTNDLPTKLFSATTGNLTIVNGLSNVKFDITHTYAVSVKGSFVVVIRDNTNSIIYTSDTFSVDIKVGVNVTTESEYLTIHEPMVITLPVTEVNVVDNTVIHWNVVRTGMSDSNFSAMSGIYTTGATAELVEPGYVSKGRVLPTTDDQLYSYYNNMNDNNLVSSVNLDKYIRFELLHNDDQDLTGSFHVVLTNDKGDVLDTSEEMSVDIRATATVSDVLSKFDKPDVVNARVNTTNVPIGTKLSWKVIHTGTVDADYSQLSGTFTVSEYGNNVTFNLLQPTLDTITGSFYLVVYNSASKEIGKSIVATVDIPVNVSILDLPPVITRSTDLQLSVRLTNIPDISKLHWEIVHTGASDSNYSRLSGGITSANNTFDYTTAVEPSYALQCRVLPTDGDQLYSYFNNMYNSLSEINGYIVNSTPADGSIVFSVIKQDTADVTGSFYIVIKDDTGKVLYTSGTTLVVMYDNYSITNVPDAILANGNVTMNLTALGATDGAVYNWTIHTKSVNDSIYSSLTGASTINSTTSTINFTVNSAKVITDTIYLTVVDSNNKLVTATRLIPVSIK
jgi:hypothetical protein